MKEVPYRFLMVDGTKVHLQGPGGKDLGYKEMRWALASVGPGCPFEPVGFWIDTGWDTIRHDLENRLNYGKLEVLFSDGGPGMHNPEQNCHPFRFKVATYSGPKLPPFRLKTATF